MAGRTGPATKRKPRTPAPDASERPANLAHGRWLGDFPRLSPAERALVACCGRGDVWTPKDWDGTRPEARRAANAIRAGLIRFLALGGDADHPLHEAGVMVQGAWIAGTLDLHQCRLPVRLDLKFCLLAGEPVFTAASLPELALSGSLVPGLRGDRLRVAGGLFLRDGFSSEGEVRLLGAEIGGDLGCNGGTFANPEGNALLADRAVVKGGVYLRNEFSATGEVRLLGAQIGGNLDCCGGTFANPSGNALSADGAVVKGDVFLRNGFSATGEVRLLGAEIGGDLDCDDGTFANPSGNALSADGAVVKGSVLLRNKFWATGVVRLPVAEIDGNLDCDGGTFTNTGGDALAADGAAVKGELSLREAKVGGGLSLAAMHVGTLADDAQCWAGGGHVLDGLSYDRIDGPTAARMRIAWLLGQHDSQLGIAPGTDFAPQPWEQLAAVLRAMGHPHEARRIAIEKQRAMRRAGIYGLPPAQRCFGRSLGVGHNLRALRERIALAIRHPFRLLDEARHRLFGALSGYGHRPWRILAWVTVLWLGFTALYWVFGVGCPNVSKCTGNLGASALYSLDALLPVDFGMVKASLPVDALGVPDSTDFPVRSLSVVETLIGWIFGVLVLAIVGNLVRKD